MWRWFDRHQTVRSGQKVHSELHWLDEWKERGGRERGRERERERERERASVEYCLDVLRNVH